MIASMLKQGTKELHDIVENNPFMQKLSNETFEQEDYILLLTLFYQLHHLIELQLLEFPSLEMKKRERCNALKRDLAYYGFDEIALRKLPPMDLEIKIDSLSKAYGVLYVLEGSRMGGLFLAKMIKQRLGEHAPVSYFEGLKEKTVAHIDALKHDLNTLELDPEEMLRSAKDLFILIDYLFKQSQRV